MARPPSDTDLKLKAAGRALLQAKGITGLSVREACRLAGVNTGMFHYYFGSKEEFLKAVLKELYAEFMYNFKAGVSAAGTPRDRLKAALIEVGKFALAMRHAAPMLFSDLAHGKKEAFTFLSGNFTEHVKYIAALAVECRPASAVKGHSAPFIIAGVLPVMVFPMLMGAVMERNGVKSLGGIPLGKLREEIFSDEGIAERAEMALRGIGL
ncbi:MAG: TetR/AcrR family transcriptional regulator [Elusimicrobiales bacterium]|nr:TetR/AcrR family transcriptional regulator [Elusimicrobiales bacterium]